MGNLLNAAEVLDIAVEKEKKRRDFYGRATKLAKEENAKKVFKFLEGEEEKHVEIFTKIRERVDEDEATESYKGELDDYSRSLIDDFLYSELDNEEFVKKAADNNQIIQLALGFEKDAILFFLEMKRFVTERHHKTLELLIEQEKSHIRKLLELRGQLS